MHRVINLFSKIICILIILAAFVNVPRMIDIYKEKTDPLDRTLQIASELSNWAALVIPYGQVVAIAIKAATILNQMRVIKLQGCAKYNVF